MQFSTIAAALLLPLLAVAETGPTTTLTSTAHLTRTVTVSEVIASVTLTYPAGNSTIAGPTAVGTTSYSTTAVGTGGSSGTGSAPTPSGNLPVSGASSLNSLYAGSAGVLVMVAAAFL